MLIQGVADEYEVPLNTRDHVVPGLRDGAWNVTRPAGELRSTSDVKFSCTFVSTGVTNGSGPFGAPKYLYPARVDVAVTSEIVWAPAPTPYTVTGVVDGEEYGALSSENPKWELAGTPVAETVTFEFRFTGRSPSQAVSLIGPLIVIGPLEIGQKYEYSQKPCIGPV